MKKLVMKKVITLKIFEFNLFEPKVFADNCGLSFESFNHSKSEATILRSVIFFQDNHYRSAKSEQHCLHDQIQQLQSKLSRTLLGLAFV